MEVKVIETVWELLKVFWRFLKLSEVGEGCLNTEILKTALGHLEIFCSFVKLPGDVWSCLEWLRIIQTAVDAVVGWRRLEKNFACRRCLEPCGDAREPKWWQEQSKGGRERLDIISSGMDEAVKCCITTQGFSTVVLRLLQVSRHHWAFSDAVQNFLKPTKS